MGLRLQADANEANTRSKSNGTSLMQWRTTEIEFLTDVLSRNKWAKQYGNWNTIHKKRKLFVRMWAMMFFLLSRVCLVLFLYFFYAGPRSIALSRRLSAVASHGALVVGLVVAFVVQRFIFQDLVHLHYYIIYFEHLMVSHFTCLLTNHTS